MSSSSCPPSSEQQKRGSPGLDAAIKKASSKALQYEYQMKDLESKLNENLSNFRAIESILQEASTGLQNSSKRADRAVTHHVPHIHRALDQSSMALSELAEQLPTVRTQISSVRKVYDSGRRKAKDLVNDLEWLNTDWHERWRLIIFTPSSPVSWRWKTIMRALFALTFVVCTWAMWIVLRGAIRAHKQRLVWGERLMS